MIENTDTELIREPPKKDSRETLYHCTSHLLYALLSEADEDEKLALYRSLEHLGIAQIRGLNASTADMESPGAGSCQTTNSTNRKDNTHGKTTWLLCRGTSRHSRR
jgi:hypothetical protein